MKVKTNLRAGSGSSAVDTSTASNTNKATNAGGANAGGGKATFVVIYSGVGRCVGI